MERIAEALLEREVLDGAEVKALIDGQPLQPLTDSARTRTNSEGTSRFPPRRRQCAVAWAWKAGVRSLRDSCFSRSTCSTLTALWLTPRLISAEPSRPSLADLPARTLNILSSSGTSATT